MGFFSVTDKADPTKERRMVTLFLLKHKKKQQNIEQATQKIDNPQEKSPIDRGVD